MSDGRPRPGRARRVLRGAAAFLVSGWRTLLVDALVVVTWLLALLLVFDWLGWPSWAFYVALFAGIAAYSALATWWGERGT